MDLPVNQFKRALREGRTTFGAWLTSGTPSTAEALGCAGFDFLVVDMEHTPVDTPQMIDAAARRRRHARAGGRAHAVERHGDGQARARRRRAVGADAVRAERRRGAARGRVYAVSARRRARRRRPHRASRYGTVAELPAESRNDEICVIVQIETLAALEQPAGDRRRARHRFHLHRAERPLGVDGPAGRHRQRRRAGEVEARRAAVPATRQAVRHHRRQLPSSSRSSPITATLDRHRLRHGLHGGPRAGMARQGESAAGCRRHAKA